MYLYWIKYAIFLVLISPEKSANPYVENVTDDNITPAKLLTNLWKVPWMNLNSSWTDKVSKFCADDISTLFRSADDGEMWALTSEYTAIISRVFDGINYYGDLQCWTHPRRCRRVY